MGWIWDGIVSPETTRLLGWTLLHSVWEGGLVWVVFLIMLRLLRGRSANAHYLCGCGALLVTALLPVSTAIMLRHSESGSGEEVLRVAATERSGDVRSVAEGAAGGVDSVVVDAAFDSDEEWSFAAEGFVGSSSPEEQSAASAVELTLPYVVLFWAAGVFCVSLWHVTGWSRTQYLRRCGLSSVGDGLGQRWARLGEGLGITRKIRFVESVLVKVPMVIGWWLPVVLVPGSIISGVSVEQLEAIVLHELAHIRRCDYLVNLVQIWIETLFFYHPAVWWISHKIRLERENCCDDLAVSAVGDEVVYVSALAEIAERCGNGPLAVVAANGGSLYQRVQRLVGLESKRSAGNSWTGVAAVLVVLTLLVMPAVYAQEHPTATELLDKYAAYQEKIGSSVQYVFNWDYEQLMDVKIGFGSGGAGDAGGGIPAYRSMQWGYVKCDGDRIRVITRTGPSLPLNSPRKHRSGRFPDPVKHGDYSSTLWSGGQDISYQAPPAKKDRDRWTMYPLGTVMISTSELIKNRNENYKSISGDKFLWGFYDQDWERADRFMRGAKTISVREKLSHVGRSKCYVVEAETTRGRYVLWIDPDRGYNIVKAQVTRKDGDQYGWPGLWKETLRGKTVRSDFRLQDVLLKKVNGLWIPVRGQTQVKDSRKGIPYNRSRSRFTRYYVSINPDFAPDAFLPNDIMDWASVSFGQYEGYLEDRSYYWLKGLPVDYQGRVVNTGVEQQRAREPILRGKPLPSFESLGVNIDVRRLGGRRLLVVFCNMNEMSSWYQVVYIVQRHRELIKQGVTTIVVQCPPLAPGTLAEWEKKYRTMPWPLPFKVNMVRASRLHSQQQWGIRSLPWSILTDENHIVTAEGFQLPLLLGRRLPDLSKYDLQVDLKKAEGKQILLCVGDLSTSGAFRYTAKMLAEKPEQLREHDIVVVPIQAPGKDDEQLSRLWRLYNDNQPIDLPFTMVDKYSVQLVQEWTGHRVMSARGLWLILTNRDHVVTAENFSLLNLDEKIRESQTTDLNDLPLIKLQTPARGENTE